MNVDVVLLSNVNLIYLPATGSRHTSSPPVCAGKHEAGRRSPGG